MPRYIPVIFLLCFCGWLLSTCMETDEKKETGIAENKGRYTGSASCTGCHKEIVESHSRTAHFMTSRPADEKDIPGSFQPGKNIYTYSPSLYIAMEKRDSGLYQAVYFKGEKKKDLRFDLITGSGAKGQTYLYWVHNKLFQMPISYYTAAAQWSVSPGFPKDKVLLDKPITSRCLECHFTWVNRLSSPDIPNEEYDRQNILFGVDCEKCHGPAGEHIAYHTRHPGDSSGKFIRNPANFSRQQQLDMCVVCHGGNLQKTRPSFSFLPGDTLASFFAIDTSVPVTVNTDQIDVHGNQYGLLRASACFRNSGMTCRTCHAPHENERGNTRLFSGRCMQCHTPAGSHFCTLKPVPAGIEQNCIDCHMPKKPSMAVTLFLSGEELPKAAMIRSHFIRIYPEETKKFKPLTGR